MYNTKNLIMSVGIDYITYHTVVDYHYIYENNIQFKTIYPFELGASKTPSPVM